MLRKIIFLFAIFSYSIVLGQNDSLINLKEVNLVDTQLINFSTTQNTIVLTDSVIAKNQSSLTDLLRFNSTIYFKENGKGMVSSPSFRGTTAQQTAVVWNGININSQFNGQTDFNTIDTRNFGSISVRSGGGSVIYGSGAVGGTIHLQNKMNFANCFSNKISVDYGSFSTLGVNYNVIASNDNLVAQANISHNSSNNDYEYIGYDKKNRNGEYKNTSFSTQFGYKISKTTFLKFYSFVFDGDRHFSGTIASPSKSKYLNLDTRNLIELSNYSTRFTTKLKVAFLNEEYKYFENKDNDNYSFGKSKTFIAKYDWLYHLSSKLKINSIIDFSRNSGFGSSIEKNRREISSFTLLFKQQLFSKFQYELGLRKELTSNYKSPFLFSFGSLYAPFKWYDFKISASKNFRVPTFNDLYWQGSGNLDLRPEHSLQGEVGQVFKYKNVQLSTSAYYSKIKDMLRWVPNASGVWQPINTDKVTIYGVESFLKWDKQIKHNNISVTTSYAYTVSENELTKKQLIYVPYHKFTGVLAYSYKNISANFQTMFNGEVFTSSDNANSLKEYMVSNFGMDYSFVKSKLTLGFQALNIENKPYQNVASRPMPGRNFKINLIFNF